jgi:uncharacterized protein
MQKTASRAESLRRLFGLPEQPTGIDRQTVVLACKEVARLCSPGQVILIHGPSGSGKTLLLRELEQELGLRGVCTDALNLPDWPVIDCLHQLELEEALELLSRFGLAEARTYLAHPQQLCAGQRFRLRLALGYAQLLRRAGRSDAGVLLADEFATQLDRISARIIARNLARTVRRQGDIAALVATCHEDLGEALCPDAAVRCDFGQYIIHHVENRHGARR